MLEAQGYLLALLTPQHRAEDAAHTFTDLRVISALLCLSWPLAVDSMEPGLAVAVSEHVRLLGTGHSPPLDRQPNSVLATAGLLTAAVAVLSSPDLPRSVARHVQARPAGRLSPSSWARVLSRHQAECSPSLRDAVAPLASARKPITATPATAETAQSLP
jgi:hypothetical protein